MNDWINHISSYHGLIELGLRIDGKYKLKFDNLSQVSENLNKNNKNNKMILDLKKLDDWWENFELQFNEISALGKFPNSSYKVYLYDGEGSFMKYISELVTKEMNLYSKKDSWNPADVWLVKSAQIQKEYIEK